MAYSCPDVIGEYMVAPERFATNGLQYAGYFEPTTAAVGEVANLFLFLQNILNAPLTIKFHVSLPKEGSFFGGGSMALETEETEFEVELDRVEAGLLTIPVRVTNNAKKKTYQVTIEPKVKALQRTERVRPEKSRSNLKTDLIDNPVGLNLIGALGANFKEVAVKKADFALDVRGQSSEVDETPLKYSYQTVFSSTDAEYYNRASQEIALRRVQLDKELTTEALYVSLFGASTIKFADAGLPLRVGEAITLSKMLTYSCQYFLHDSNLYNGLLLPIWERAFEVDYNTADALDVICRVGYHHLLKIAIAFSFGTIAQVIGKQPWSLEERQGVTNFIADSVETGQPLEIDFLYLPLLMAGTHLSKEVIMEGEDVRHSLALLQTARAARPNLFAEPEMAKANDIYNTLIKQVAR